MNTKLDRKQLIYKSEVELDKVIIFVRMGVRNLDIKIPTEFLDNFLKKLEQQSHGMRIGIEVSIRDSSFERTIVYGVFGAAVGSLIGAQIAGVPGAIAGAVCGAVSGGIAAKLYVRIELDSNEQLAVISVVG